MTQNFVEIVTICLSLSHKGGGRRAIFRSSSLQNQNKNYGYYGSNSYNNRFESEWEKWK